MYWLFSRSLSVRNEGNLAAPGETDLLGTDCGSQQVALRAGAEA